MNSETSTEPDPSQSLQPWQFFVLAALVCATALTFIVRSQGLMAVVLLTVLMGATALIGLAVLRTVRPLVSNPDDRTVMIGDRTRAALDREKMLALRAIKELEFDHSMGKISHEDFREMETRLRARAIRLMQQLEAGAGYRERIEQDLSKRLGDSKGPLRATEADRPSSEGVAPPAQTAARDACGNCSTANDADAKFCKSCGHPL